MWATAMFINPAGCIHLFKASLFKHISTFNVSSISIEVPDDIVALDIQTQLED